MNKPEISKHKTQEKLESLTFTCGASRLDLELPAYLSDVCVRDMTKLRSYIIQ